MAVFAEGPDDAGNLNGQGPVIVLGHFAVVIQERADPRAGEVGVEVPASHLGHGVAPVDVAADDRHPFLAAVVNLGDEQPGAVAIRDGRVTASALHEVPAVVDPPCRGVGHVDLLPSKVAHVGDVDLGAVEAEPPRIAQPVGPDFGEALSAVGEGVVSRDVVGVTAVDVDADDGTQLGVGILAVVEGVALAASVADGGIQIAVGAELELAALVGGGGRPLLKGDDLAGSGGVSSVRVIGIGPVLIDLAVAVRVAVEHEEPAVGRIVGVEGQTQQPPLGAALGADQGGDIQERLR